MNLKERGDGCIISSYFMALKPPKMGPTYHSCIKGVDEEKYVKNGKSKNGKQRYPSKLKKENYFQ